MLFDKYINLHICFQELFFKVGHYPNDVIIITTYIIHVHCIENMKGSLKYIRCFDPTVAAVLTVVFWGFFLHV